MTKKYYLSVMTIALIAIIACCLVFSPTDVALGAISNDLAVSLSNPNAITSLGEKLYVADTIEEDGQQYTIIHIITPEGLNSLFTNKTLMGKTNDLAISPNGNYLYLMQMDKIIICDLTQEVITLKTLTVTNVKAIEACADAIMYAYTSGSFSYVGARHVDDFDTELKPHNFYTASIKYLAKNPLDDGQVTAYFEMSPVLYSTQLTVDDKTITLDTVEENKEILNDATQLAEFKNVFNFMGETFFFTSTAIKNILSNEEAPELQIWSDYDFLAKDVAVAGDTIFVLCDYSTQAVAGKVNGYYQKPRLRYATLATTTAKPEILSFDGELGASELNYAIPTFDASEIKIATASGYPSNIIYRPTSDDFTQNDILKDKAIDKDKFAPTDKFLVLKQSSDRLFSYVFFEGKFGWVRNSDCLKIDKTATGNSLYGITLLNANVYDLPYESDDFLSTFSLEKLANVTVLGEYNNFYLIKYNPIDGPIVHGFVFCVSVGTSTPPKEYVTYLRRAANPVVGKQLEIFATKETDTIENNYLSDVNGNQITVKGGKEVRLYEELENGVCYVGVIVDNVLYKGYVKSVDLLKTYNLGMTNSQILATACIAIVAVIIAYVVILRLRSKKLEAAKEEANAKLNSKGLTAKDDESNDNFFDITSR